MKTHSENFKIRLALFILGGIVLFVLTIFIIGKQRNLFNPVFSITTTFYNVSGLQVGNNIRFAGVNVGTVDQIAIINDSTVEVEMILKKEIQQFVKTDSEVGIGSEGLIGDKLLVISKGSAGAAVVQEGQWIASSEPVEMDAILASVQVTSTNVEVITDELAQIMVKINSGNGIIGRLLQDSTVAQNLNQTIINLKKSSKGLNENMQAAKHNFFLRGYFNRKAKAAEKKKEEALKKKK